MFSKWNILCISIYLHFSSLFYIFKAKEVQRNRKPRNKLVRKESSIKFRKSTVFFKICCIPSFNTHCDEHGISRATYIYISIYYHFKFNILPFYNSNICTILWFNFDTKMFINSHLLPIFSISYLNKYLFFYISQFEDKWIL